MLPAYSTSMHQVNQKQKTHFIHFYGLEHTRYLSPIIQIEQYLAFGDFTSGVFRLA